MNSFIETNHTKAKNCGQWFVVPNRQWHVKCPFALIETECKSAFPSFAIKLLFSNHNVLPDNLPGSIM